MLPEGTLQRAAHKVANYIEKYVKLVGAERREEVLELFENMHRVFPQWVIMTCPMMHPDIHYISKNGQYVFGYSNEDLLKNSVLESFFPHVHESDQQDLHDCFAYVHDFLESVPSEEHCNYRVVFNYRFRKENGQYMHLHDEKATLSLRGSGNLYYVLIRDITSEKAFAGVKIELFKQEQTLIKIKEFKPSADRNPLSKREEELVTLIKQGLSTKEIAWYLKISHKTVRNIKSKLFEKYNVNNSIELLNMTG
ncbi:MAG: LuxR C-terminal-related transcriptional regulator [Chitinophagaceae bacterium]